MRNPETKTAISREINNYFFDLQELAKLNMMLLMQKYKRSKNSKDLLKYHFYRKKLLYA
jgi:hypothetical protein